MNKSNEYISVKPYDFNTFAPNPKNHNPNKNGSYWASRIASDRAFMKLLKPKDKNK